MNHASEDLQTLFLSDKALATRYEVHRTSIWRWAQNDKLPAPFKINGATRWKLSDIEAWEAKQGGAV